MLLPDEKSPLQELGLSGRYRWGGESSSSVSSSYSSSSSSSAAAAVDLAAVGAGALRTVGASPRRRAGARAVIAAAASAAAAGFLLLVWRVLEAAEIGGAGGRTGLDGRVVAGAGAHSETCDSATVLSFFSSEAEGAVAAAAEYRGVVKSTDGRGGSAAAAGEGSADEL